MGVVRGTKTLWSINARISLHAVANQKTPLGLDKPSEPVRGGAPRDALKLGQLS